EAVIDVMQRAQCGHLLDRPEGRMGRIGERGARLSGGELQRMAIARAMLVDAPLVLLDEPTSALDSDAEAAVELALAELFRDRTVVAVAHRLSTLRRMDRIIVIQDGRVLEEGPHDALRARDGLYAALWRTQANGYIS